MEKFSNSNLRQKNNYLLAQITPLPEIKQKKLVEVKQKIAHKWEEQIKSSSSSKKDLEARFTFLYPYGISHQDLQALIKVLNLPLLITTKIQYADVILTVANLAQSNKKLRQISNAKKLSIHMVSNNNLVQMSKSLYRLFKKTSMLKLENLKMKTLQQKFGRTELLTALEETRLVIEEIIIPRQLCVDLKPRTNVTRKLQYELALHYQLKSISIGAESKRRIRIYPNLW
jgi:hypothetical protein